MIIDAHLHLWDKQNGLVNGKPVYAVGGGKSEFGGEVLQMQPPYMYDGKNLAEVLIANMDYARVSGCVVTQEYIDGNQDEYLLKAKASYPDRIKICSLYEDYLDDTCGGADGGDSQYNFKLDGFDGIKICAGRLKDKDLTKIAHVFKAAETKGKFVSIDLADGDAQVASMREIIKECPNLRIAIGHFGMVTVDGWEEQIKLATNKNVRIESGGITWLFNKEFYPFKGAVDAILRAKELCGIDKLMWGSDYPRTMTEITYKMSLDFVTKSKEISEEDKLKFIGGNAYDFYKFNNLVEPKYIKNILE